MKGIRFLVFLVAVGLLVWAGQRYLAGQEQPIEDHYYCAFYELADHLAKNGTGGSWWQDPATGLSMFNAYHHAVVPGCICRHFCIF